MKDSIFDVPAPVDLQGVRSLRDIAAREGFTSAADYSAQFAHALCNSGSMDALRERFVALTNAASCVDFDKAATDEVGQHYIILEAIFRKLIIQSVAATGAGGKGSSEAGERLFNGALKAQRAAMACLSALKVLRDAASLKPPTTPRAGRHASGAVGAGLLAEPLALSAHSK